MHKLNYGSMSMALLSICYVLSHMKRILYSSISIVLLVLCWSVIIQEKQFWLFNWRINWKLQWFARIKAYKIIQTPKKKKHKSRRQMLNRRRVGNNSKWLDSLDSARQLTDNSWTTWTLNETKKSTILYSRLWIWGCWLPKLWRQPTRTWNG